MYVMEHRCAGKLSGGFGGPFMYVLSPTSTKPKYRLIKMKKKKGLNLMVGSISIFFQKQGIIKKNFPLKLMTSS